MRSCSINKVYFTETKPGFFEKNTKFKVKTNLKAETISKKSESIQVESIQQNQRDDKIQNPRQYWTKYF